MKAFIVLSMVLALVASFTVPEQSTDRRIRRSAWGDSDEGEIKEVTVHKTVHVPYPVVKKVPVVIEKKVPVVIEKKVPVYIKEKKTPITIRIKKQRKIHHG
ncbi:uncharacterized protein LOC131435940 [Malaya genurostris]|uniref:uncharacterized protein LOC131435940 n=1 Tax=Malaya genurostris TaxID=325434 RepID=UPI0026F38CB8|nr:uncharacterized protein LOC131435940 [Malaya genurostris]